MPIPVANMPVGFLFGFLIRPILFQCLVAGFKDRKFIFSRGTESPASGSGSTHFVFAAASKAGPILSAPPSPVKRDTPRKVVNP
jgi:hypothetical protein